MARVAKSGKGQGKAEDESSSHGGGKAQATEGVAEEELVGDVPAENEFAMLDALATAETELQEEEETVEVAELEAEWLGVGSQAPETVLDQRPCKCI